MRGSGQVLTAAMLLAPLLVALPAPAEAYLDPGTGSYVFQMLVATAVSLGFILKAYWRRLVELITRRRRGETPPPPDVG